MGLMERHTLDSEMYEEWHSGIFFQGSKNKKTVPLKALEKALAAKGAGRILWRVGDVMRVRICAMRKVVKYIDTAEPDPALRVKFLEAFDQTIAAKKEALHKAAQDNRGLIESAKRKTIFAIALDFITPKQASKTSKSKQEEAKSTGIKSAWR